MALTVHTRPIVVGAAEGPFMRLAAPISFWGGIDPTSGRITQPRHPDHRRTIAGSILAIPCTIGSSSGSAVLLELIHCGHAPLGLVLGQADAILSLGVIVAREMGYGSIPVLHTNVENLPMSGRASISSDGALTVS